MSAELRGGGLIVQCSPLAQKQVQGVLCKQSVAVGYGRQGRSCKDASPSLYRMLASSD